MLSLDLVTVTKSSWCHAVNAQFGQVSGPCNPREGFQYRETRFIVAAPDAPCRVRLRQLNDLGIAGIPGAWETLLVVFVVKLMYS